MKLIKRQNNLISKAPFSLTHRVMISVPLTGLIRAEWALARYGQMIPCNWSQAEVIAWMDMFSPLGFLVADARNVAIQQFMAGKFEWLYFIDHDVLLPPATFARWNEYMLSRENPIWGGLYFTKSRPSEPLTYRGLGTGYYADWKIGDKIWIDGMGLGNNVIHRSIIEAVYNDVEEYQIGALKLRRVFNTPQNTYFDAESQTWNTSGGTEDLDFYHRLKNKGYFKKAGWSKHQAMEYPLLCDTEIFGRHIDWDGVQYPAHGEEKQFERKAKK